MSKVKIEASGEDFALELKVLCQKFRVGELRAEFVVLIDDHSVSHHRLFTYKSPEQNPEFKTEVAELQVIAKKRI